jgi:hypothetical protein
VSARRAAGAVVRSDSKGMRGGWLERGAWIAAAVLLLAGGWRAASRPNPYAPGAPLPRVEDRRDHRFRDLTYVQAQKLLDSLLRAADRAPDAHQRAVALARAAALQHERGYPESADTAAREAVRIAPNDPEVRRLLASPLDLRELQQSP